jgi:hypothetical protein
MAESGEGVPLTHRLARELFPNFILSLNGWKGNVGPYRISRPRALSSEEPRRKSKGRFDHANSAKATG